MTKSNTILIGIVGVIVLVGFVLGVAGFLRGLQEPQTGISPEIVDTFQDELITRGIERGGQPIEGFDAFLLMRAFPGLQENDFDGVLTGIFQEEGLYSYADGELRWNRTKYQSITSGEKTVSKDGYGVLLKNLSERLGMPASIVEEAIALIDAIDIPADVAEHIASKRDFVVVHDPRPLSVVTSPLTVGGEARGPWYFEADFQLTLVDWNGRVIAESFATAQDDWMTTEFVPFEGTIEFENPVSSDVNEEHGTLIFQKANPSGLPEHADELRIPVRFAAESDTREQTIELYYYDPSLDEDESGNILCSEKGLVAVERRIPVTRTPIQDAVRLLLLGEITRQEEARGITTEYPLEGLELQGASLENGVLTLSFADPNSATSGGSCRAGILWLQIRETAKQFNAVEEARFQPEELFQP